MSMSSYYLGVAHDDGQLLHLSNAWKGAVIAYKLRMSIAVITLD